jgi:hypothetical protein
MDHIRLLTLRGTLLQLVTVLTVILLLNPALMAASRPNRVIRQPPPPAEDAAPSSAPNVKPASPPAILSIIPAQAEPGNRVVIYGSGFNDDLTVMLGTVEAATRVSDGKQLEFTVPLLDPGLYALYLRRGDAATGRTYNFSVLPQRPVLTALSPDRISSCAQGAEREVTAQGRNFSESSQILFDNAVIVSRLISREALLFKVPQSATGLHQIQVRNSPETSSAALALEVETRPEISQITVGNEYVNYYELQIEGKNFQQNSAIYVDGRRIGGHGGQNLTERDQLIYIDCTRLIYQRYPYSPVAKDFRIQVMNPGGEGSQVVNVTAP